MSTFQKQYWERKNLLKRRPPWHPVIMDYALSKILQIQKHIAITEKTRLLDVGAGNGFFSFYFDKLCETYAIDYSAKMLEMNPVKNKFFMNAEHLEFETDSFDIVFCHALLHHVEDIDKVLSEMRRVSRKYVVIIEPNRNNPLMFLFSAIVKEERKALKFSLGYLQKMVTRGGLDLVASFSHGLTVPNKTPVGMLKLLKKANCRIPFGMTNILIAKK